MADNDIAVVAAAWYLLEKKTKTRAGSGPILRRDRLDLESHGCQSGH